MPTTTNVAQVKLNIMTKAQYNAATKVATELYAVTDGGAVDEIIEFQQPTAANNYTWYRKYADGWVEQGGMATNSANSVTLPVEMFDTNYTVIRTIAEGFSTQSYYPAWVAGYTTRTTTGFTFDQVAPNNIWFVCGMAAN